MATGPRHDHLDGRYAEVAAIPGHNPGPVADGARSAAAGIGVVMELSIRFLGLDLLTVCVTTDVPEYDEPGESTAYPLGFVARHELPDEAGLRDRQEWGE